MKGQVSAPRLIGDERAAAGVADLGDSGEIRACPIRCRAGDQPPPRVGMRIELVCERRRGRGMGQMQVRIPGWLHPDRPDPGQNQARDHRLMRVAAHQQLFIRPGHRKHRGLNRQGAAARREERLLSANGVGHQLLGPLKHPGGRSPVIQPRGRQHIGPEHVFSQHRQHPGIRTAALLVPRRRERNLTPAVVSRQRIEDWRLRVIHACPAAPTAPDETATPDRPERRKLVSPLAACVGGHQHMSCLDGAWETVPLFSCSDAR